jgi:hypothetical protein
LENIKEKLVFFFIKKNIFFFSIKLVSDYALPLAVCAMTLIANFWFGDVPSKIK